MRILAFFFLLLVSGLGFYSCTTPPTAPEKQTEVVSNETQKEKTVAEPTKEKVVEASKEVVSDASKEVIPETEPEITNIGEVNQKPDLDHLRCNGMVVQAWPLNDKISTGTFQATQSNGVFQATFDASAGGVSLLSKNPFIYLDLHKGKKVEITDLQSLTNKTWAIGFKRYLIRVNSGDSGSGNVVIGKLSKTTFEKVVSVPSGTKFEKDKTLDDNCQLLRDPLEGPQAAINVLNFNNPTKSQSWYQYNQGVSPTQGDIYLIQDDTKTTFKLEILSWKSGVYSIQWAKLP